MVGSAISRASQTRGYTNLIAKTSKDLDLRNQADVNTYFKAEKLDVVIDSAARVGGILANNEDPN
jgi:GDP-L-fucose synthase